MHIKNVLQQSSLVLVENSFKLSVSFLKLNAKSFQGRSTIVFYDKLNLGKIFVPQFVDQSYFF
ncbi:hypothetical protein LEP1GSC073_3840 [Leptospira noguchii str. Cascata]|nr:hypothetical protein LEP1GSC072_2899 [Leptospira noguchii str. Bonito]EMS88567.1 hypothetical protein LEP1GSC073_3840 [Leptospira noguchii str. Cascata]